MKIRDGKAENLNLDGVCLLDISQGIAGVSDAMDCLVNGSTPIGKSKEKQIQFLASAGNVLAAINHAIMQNVADPMTLEDALADDEQQAAH